jgi:hypothetical protein
MNAAEDEWGEERLIQTVKSCLGLPPAEIIACIMRTADTFVAGAKQNDDMNASLAAPLRSRSTLSTLRRQLGCRSKARSSVFSRRRILLLEHLRGDLRIVHVDQLAKVPAFLHLPVISGLHRDCAAPAVSVLAQHAGLDQVQQQLPAEDQPAGRVEVLQHALGIDQQRVDQIGGLVEQIVRRIVESGRITRSTDECEMSRSCHKRNVLQRGLRVARTTRASPESARRSRGCACAASPTSPSASR